MSISYDTVVDWIVENKDVILTSVKYFLGGFTILYLLFAYFYAWKQWNAHFGGQRVSRRVKDSPSNAQPPVVVSYEDSKGQILAAAETLELADDDNLLAQLTKNTGRKSVKSAATHAARKKAARIQTMRASSLDKMQAQMELTSTGKRKTITSAGGSVNVGSLSNENAEGLDMDHVYLSFPQLLWGYTFVGLNAHLLMVKNTTLLRLRVWLNKLGLVKPIPVDYDAFAAKMVLETSMACYYKSKVGNIAAFFFPGKFLYIIYTSVYDFVHSIIRLHSSHYV